MAKSSRRSSAPAQPADDDPGQGGVASTAEADGAEPGDRENAVAELARELSFREAQTALELCLAQLQDQDLDVEAMADLYRRALAYAERCEAVLVQVEQEVMQWDPGQPDQPPSPYAP